MLLYLQCIKRKIFPFNIFVHTYVCMNRLHTYGYLKLIKAYDNVPCRETMIPVMCANRVMTKFTIATAYNK